MSDTVSAKSIKAQMPHVKLTRIFGEPSHHQLKHLKQNLPPIWWQYLVLGDTTKVVLGSSRIWSFIYNAMVQPSQFQQLHRRPTLLSWPAQLQPNVRINVPITSLLARHGQPTWLSTPSYGTNLQPPLMMCTTLPSMTLLKASTLSPYDSLSPTSALHTHRLAKLILTTTSPILTKESIPTFHLLSTCTSRRSAKLLHRMQVHPSPAQGNDGDDWNQACSSQLWEHDACIARKETFSPPWPYVEQLEGSLDGCICRNARHQPHDLWQLGLCKSGSCTENCPGRENAASLDSLANASMQMNNKIDKLVMTNQQQAKIIADLTEANAKLKAGSPPTEQWLGHANPPNWRSTKPTWDPSGYCWMHGFWVKVGNSSTTCFFPS